MKKYVLALIFFLIVLLSVGFLFYYSTASKVVSSQSSYVLLIESKNNFDINKLDQFTRTAYSQYLYTVKLTDKDLTKFPKFKDAINTIGSFPNLPTKGYTQLSESDVEAYWKFLSDKVSNFTGKTDLGITKSIQYGNDKYHIDFFPVSDLHKKPILLIQTPDPREDFSTYFEIIPKDLVEIPKVKHAIDDLLLNNTTGSEVYLTPQDEIEYKKFFAEKFEEKYGIGTSPLSFGRFIYENNDLQIHRQFIAVFANATHG